MSMSKQSRVSRITTRVRKIWAELDYAQRRLLEIRTGIPDLTRRGRPLSRGS